MPHKYMKVICRGELSKLLITRVTMFIFFKISLFCNKDEKLLNFSKLQPVWQGYDITNAKIWKKVKNNCVTRKVHML